MKLVSMESEDEVREAEGEHDARAGSEKQSSRSGIGHFAMAPERTGEVKGGMFARPTAANERRPTSVARREL